MLNEIIGKTAKMGSKMFTEKKSILFPHSESAAEVAMECCNSLSYTSCSERDITCN